MMILPLKSLISDYKQKLKKIEIAFKHFIRVEGEEMITGRHGLVLVLADCCRTSG